MTKWLIHSLVPLQLTLCAASSPAANLTSESVVPLDVQISAPPTPVVGEGQEHLLYELRVTNFAARDITLESVEVLDGRSLSVIGHVSGSKLADTIGTPGRASKGEQRLTIPANGFAIIYMDSIADAGTRVARELVHRIRITSADAGAAQSRIVLQGAHIELGNQSPLLVSSPLRGAGWLAANALSNDADHRRTIAVVDGKARIAQRYAIDFVKLDRAGRAFRGDPTLNENWAGYGSPVLAVADGVIETVSDGLPDNKPLGEPSVKITLETIGGNHVVLRLPTTERVFYGHLQPGSIRVRPGQKVRRGELIGLLGNSGQSDAPHLHIHVADGSSPLGADGVAFAFRQFTLEGHVPSLMVLEDPKGWQRPSNAVDQERRNELPIQNAVIGFAN